MQLQKIIWAMQKVTSLMKDNNCTTKDKRFSAFFFSQL